MPIPIYPSSDEQERNQGTSADFLLSLNSSLKLWEPLRLSGSRLYSAARGDNGLRVGDGDPLNDVRQEEVPEIASHVSIKWQCAHISIHRDIAKQQGAD